MWPFIRRVLKITTLLVALVLLATLVLLGRGGAFRSLEGSFDGECTRLALPGSAEDIQPDRERGFAYLSLLDRRALVRGEAVQGDILRLDLNQPELAPVSALRERPGHFRPHGLSLFIDASGERYLFAINHPADAATEPRQVELFREVEPGSFTHARTFSHPLLLSPNDLAATGPAQFYVANDRVSGGALAAVLQQLGIGGSPLVYVDGESVRVVIDDIAFGGGIHAASDLRTLYVSETSGRRLRVLDRVGNAGEVRERARIPLGTAPDNIDVAPDGSLWIGAHPDMLALIRHFVQERAAPSQVLRLQLHGDKPLIEQVYLGTDGSFSAASVGVQFGDRLLIGSITEPALLVCRR